METTLKVWCTRSLLSSLVAGLLLSNAVFLTPTAHAAETINTWWPSNGAHVTGTQPFKAMVPGLEVTQYEMFWQVDGGSWNWMNNSSVDYPHKEALVDVSGWRWSLTGSYTINFIARKGGTVFAQSAVKIYVDNGTVQIAPAAATVSLQPATSTSQTVANPTPSTTTQVSVTQTQTSASAAVSSAPSAPAPSVSGNPLGGITLYVNPDSAAARQAQAWQSSNLTNARAMQQLASASTAVWFGEWNTNITKDVQSLVSRANAAGSVPIMVAYAIPQRDCGGYSSGGTNNPTAYQNWISGMATGIGSAKAVVILEPDALAQIGCLSQNDQKARFSLLADAVTTLKRNGNTKVYIDAGHSNWIGTATMANELTRANIAAADGFSLNVSNFMATSDEVGYGAALSSALSGKHFVVDTSRNGNGSNGQWCNPSGRAIGAMPTTITNNSAIDAYLWLKVPGESDGSCNGGPSAGTWWPEYALGLVQNAR